MNARWVPSVALAKEGTLRRVPPYEACGEVHGRKAVGAPQPPAGKIRRKLMPSVDYMDCFPTGPGTISGKYMRKFWHPVKRAEDIKPGWAKPIRIMSEDFTLYRGAGGKPHVVDFRCPHRQS